MISPSKQTSVTVTYPPNQMTELDTVLPSEKDKIVGKIFTGSRAVGPLKSEDFFLKKHKMVHLQTQFGVN